MLSGLCVETRELGAFCKLSWPVFTYGLALLWSFGLERSFGQRINRSSFPLHAASVMLSSRELVTAARSGQTVTGTAQDFD
jgi:hypothetical protein